MKNRRLRLDYALSILPYTAKDGQLSLLEQKVEDIIARLRTNRLDSGGSESGEDEIAKQQRQNEAADTFAEHTMRDIELSETEQPPSPEKLSPLDTLKLAAEKLLKNQNSDSENGEGEEDDLEDNEFIVDGEDELAELEYNQLMDNTIQDVNEATIEKLQRWERNKRTALDLLTIEIEKVQDMDHSDTEPQKTERLDLLNEDTVDLNTSTPKTNKDDNEDVPEDKNDEEYVPETSSKSVSKRTRLPKTMTSTPKGKRQCPGLEFDIDQCSPMIVIGPNGTKVSRTSLKAINWNMTGPSITRKILCEIFDRNTLAHHTLSGKPSPAFRDCARPAKQQLDPEKVADLVYLMTSTMEMSPREVRTAITTKCADENKMLRSRLKRGPRKTK